MNRDAEVMHDLGGPIDQKLSDAKFDRYVACFEKFGFSRWVIENEGKFLGYCGIVARRGEHPLGGHDEIGWRMIKSAWGYGYATEAAKAALIDAEHRLKLTKILSYTSSDNHRSQAVMVRIGLRRMPSLDFSFQYAPNEIWTGLVWRNKASD